MARVLVVDDYCEVRRLIRRVLSASDYQVADAGSAEQALQLMACAPADVVITDVHMPGRDGLWLASEIRARYPTCSVIFVSSLRDVAPDDIEQLGVTAYLPKPLDLHDLISAVASALTSSSLEH